MARKNSRPQRLDPEFEHEMKELARIRVKNNLANLNKSDVSMREMTNLLRRTQGYRISMEELKTKPKRR